MQLVPLTSAVWQQYASWFMHPPSQFRHGLFVADVERSLLLAGVRYEETGEGLVVFSQFMVNQAIPEPERVKARRGLLKIAAGYCLTRGAQGMLLGSVEDGMPAVQACILRTPETLKPQSAAPVREAPSAPPEEAEETAAPDEDQEDELDRVMKRAAAPKKPSLRKRQT